MHSGAITGSSSIPRFTTPTNAPKVDPKTGNVIAGSGNLCDGNGNSRHWLAIHRVRARGHRGLLEVSTTASFKVCPLITRCKSTLQFQPRAGIAYQVNGKTVIRTGIGRFLTRVGGGGGEVAGTSSLEPTHRSSSFATVTNVSVDNPGASLSSAQQAALTVTTLPRNLKPPESWNWNFTVQRELPWKLGSRSGLRRAPGVARSTVGGH